MKNTNEIYSHQSELKSEQNGYGNLTAEQNLILRNRKVRHQMLSSELESCGESEGFYIQYLQRLQVRRTTQN
jgi:hypothetical protein